MVWIQTTSFFQRCPTRLLLVLLLILIAWIGEGACTWAGGLEFLECAAAGVLLSRSRSARLRFLAPLPALSFLLGIAIPYAAAPDPMRPAYAALLVATTGLALHLVVGPLVRRWRTGRIVAGLFLSSGVLALLLAVAEPIYSRFQPVDPYALVPVEGGAKHSSYLFGDKKLGRVFRRGFRGRFVHPEFHGELIEINNCGYRDLDWPERPDPDTVGILLLGDSTLFGLGVNRDETIAADLERELALRRPGQSFRAYNAGVPGYGPRQELEVLRRMADRLRPRLCLTFFYDGNDLEDCRRQFVETREAGFHSDRLPSEDLEQGGLFQTPNLLAAPGAAGIPPLWTRSFWARYSSLFRDIDLRITNRVVGLGWAPVCYAYNNGALRSMARQPDIGSQDEMHLAVQALQEIDEECTRRGIAAGVIRLPGSIQCEPSTCRRALEELGLDPREFDRARPGATIVEEARKRGEPACDLLPVLEVREGELCPFYWREGHPNRAGNARIARETATFLESNGKLARALTAGANDADR